KPCGWIPERGGFAPLGHRQTARYDVDQKPAYRRHTPRHQPACRVRREPAVRCCQRDKLLILASLNSLSDTSQGPGRKRAAERFAVADPAKKGFDIEQRGLLCKFRPRLVCCVFQHHAEILQKKAVA